MVPEGHWIVVSMMSKTEIFLLIILAVILLGSIWFIFSDEIWLLLCYLESQIYPPSAFRIIFSARKSARAYYLCHLVSRRGVIA
jgi:hypothetical protein